jgi:peptidoglycan-associated lipoprotein
MKILKFFAIGAIAVFFAGCQCLEKVREDRLAKPEKEEKAEAEKVTGEEIFVKEVEKAEQPKEKPAPQKGTATAKEKEKALKGQEIPAARIPTEKVFKIPSEVSSEMAEIFRNIYFDFDKYNIKPPAREKLNKIGDFLLKNPDMEIIIEGHCDERGTREYNLVLGEQRALSARRYLVGLGIAPKRLHTVSYGEAKPADPSHNEEAWAKNRRGEFKISVEEEVK